MTRLTNLEEAKVALINWIDQEAEDRMNDIQVDDETGKTYRFSWAESFDDTVETVLGQIEDWASDYDLSYSEGKLLEEFVQELHANTFQKQLDWAKKVEEEVKLDLNEIVKKTIKDMYEEYKDVEQGEHTYMGEAFKQDFSIEKLLENLKENELFKKAVSAEIKKI